MNVTVRGRTQHFRTVTFDRARNAVLLIEQRLLPHEFKIVATKNFRETAGAIRDMVVRGARRDWRHGGLRPGPGRAGLSRARSEKIFRARRNRLPNAQAARPTAVDPVNAMNGVRAAMRAGRNRGRTAIARARRRRGICQ